MTDEQLIGKCQTGNPGAQRMLFDRYAPRMYRLARRYVPVPDDAEDIVVKAFEKVFREATKFQWRGDGSLEAWIRTIAVNEALMMLRGRHNFNITEALDDGLAIPDLSALADIDAAYLQELIAGLPTGYRTVFNLFVVEGYDHHEIAGLLNIHEGTSRSQLHKARILLKEKISNDEKRYGT